MPFIDRGARYFTINHLTPPFETIHLMGTINSVWLYTVKFPTSTATVFEWGSGNLTEYDHFVVPHEPGWVSTNPPMFKNVKLSGRTDPWGPPNMAPLIWIWIFLSAPRLVVPFISNRSPTRWSPIGLIIMYGVALAGMGGHRVWTNVGSVAMAEMPDVFPVLFCETHPEVIKMQITMKKIKIFVWTHFIFITSKSWLCNSKSSSASSHFSAGCLRDGDAPQQWIC